MLADLNARAGVVFAGQVTAVEHVDAAGYVEVRFRIDMPVKGCAGRSGYALREWAGRWAAQADRYRVGERLLMFLHAPGPGGLSSAVDGMTGKVALLASAPAVIATAGGVAPPETAQAAALTREPMADLRWLAARVVRFVVKVAAEPGPESLLISSGGGMVRSGGWAGAVAPLESAAVESGAGQPSLSSVLAVLTGDADAAQ